MRLLPLSEDPIGAVLKRLEVQSELERSGGADVPPGDRMLAITRDTGVFYNILLRSSGARRVLEIGLSAGYSTLWFAEAVRRNAAGEIVTIERNPSKVRRARRNLGEAGVAGIVTIMEGDALDILRGLRDGGDERFDFVFVDADKENCKAYFDLAFPMLRPGGIVGTDNMLYPEKYRREMREYADHIRTFDNARTVTLDVGNGQELTVKTAPG